MAQCEMCGTDAQLVSARVEGTTMRVCSTCAKFGVNLETPQVKKGPRQTVHTAYKKMEDDGLVLRDSAGNLVKQAREKLGLRQIDLAKKLNIRESIIQQFESGHLQPTSDVVKKFEAGLKIQLLTKPEEETLMIEKNTSQGFTLGDFIKKR